MKDTKRFGFVAAIVLVFCGSMFGQPVFFPGEAPLLEQIVNSGLPAPAQGSESGPVDAVKGIVSAFQHHSVVLIGEAHWLRASGDFYNRLLRDPSFQENVQDIVVEFASRNNQPLIDRYISGADVPLQDLRWIWRDTTKVAAWESPIYGELLATVREVNKNLPPARRLRILASDTAIDWSKIHTHADWSALGDNNISISDVINHEVLAKKRHALVILGGNHVTKPGNRNGGPNTTTRVEAAYPGSTYVVLLYGSQTGGWDATEELLHTPVLKAPTFYRLAGSQLANSPLSRYTDALLYLGPRESLVLAFPSRESIEPEYLKEIDRRSMIEWGELRGRKYLFSRD